MAPNSENSAEKSDKPSQLILKPIKDRSVEMEFHLEANLECAYLNAAEMLLELQSVDNLHHNRKVAQICLKKISFF